MLNGTLCATTRTLSCLLENYQTNKGIIIPEVLRKYMRGDNTIIPYIKPKPLNLNKIKTEKRKS